MMAKGQMEILGLAVVIILIVMGFLFYVKLSDTKEIDFASIENKQKASSIDAMLKTTVSCGSQKFKLIELIEDCSNNPSKIMCSTSDIVSKTQLTKMLQETLGKWKNEYYLEITSQPELVPPVCGGIKIYSDINWCNETSPGQFLSIPINTNRPQDVSILLRVCR